MTEETVTDPSPLMRAFNQSRNVRQHEIDIARFHHTEVGVQGRKRIIRNFRLCRTDRRKERRLPGVRQPHEARICDKLQAQPDPELFSLFARVCAARRLADRGLEPGIPPAAIAALGKPDAFAGLHQVSQQRLVVFVKDLRAGRNL